LQLRVILVTSSLSLNQDGNLAQPILKRTEPAKLLAVFVVDTGEKELLTPYKNEATGRHARIEGFRDAFSVRPSRDGKPHDGGAPPGSLV
jgi:hypothetical protein